MSLIRLRWIRQPFSPRPATRLVGWPLLHSPWPATRLARWHCTLIFMLLNVFHFFLFMSTMSHTLLANSAFTTSFFCKMHIIHQLRHGSLSPGGLFIGDEAFNNSAIKYVGEAPARPVALLETLVGQGRFPRGQRLSPVRATGKMVRGRSESVPDPQELMQDTDYDGSTNDDDESVSAYSDRWVSGSGRPGFFWSCRGGPSGPLSTVVPFEKG
jgi:hypothetical protein